MTRFLKAALAALALCSAAPAALAQSEPDLTPLVLAPTADGLFAATFDSSVSGLFVDAFSFAAPAFDGLVTVSFQSLSGPVSFFSAFFGEEGFGNETENPSAPFSFSAGVGAGTPLSLTLLGFAGDAATLTEGLGSYRTTVELQPVAAIPEPSTYALMLMGLALLAMAARRRARPAAVRT